MDWTKLELYICKLRCKMCIGFRNLDIDRSNSTVWIILTELGSEKECASHPPPGESENDMTMSRQVVLVT